MIINLPTAESLHVSALKSHFAACEALFSVIHQFHEFYTESRIRSEVKWLQEWNEYLEKARFDLESIYTNLALANELGLRAKICEVSPFLLLVNSENRFKVSETSIDFTELRTVDAVDLPMIANSVCDAALPQKYIGNYNKVRSLRNKIMHLGEAGVGFDYEQLVDLLSEQFATIWPDRLWLASWVEHSTRTRSAHFYDDKYYSEYTDVMALLPIIVDSLKKGQFRKLFGFPKSKRMYICHDCCAASCIERLGWDLADYKTAHLKQPNLLFCAMCGQEKSVERVKCQNDDCKGDVVSPEECLCCTCGSYQEEPDEG